MKKYLITKFCNLKKNSARLHIVDYCIQITLKLETKIFPTNNSFLDLKHIYQLVVRLEVI